MAMQLTGNVAGMLKLLGGGSDVEITQLLSEGVAIAIVKVDENTITLYAPEGGGSDVEVIPALLSGTKIADIKVDNFNKPLYAPAPTSVNVSQVLTEGVKIAEIGVNGVTTDIYAPNQKYSNNEQIIGTWTDGKPLYRKTLNITTNSDSFYYSCDDLDIDEVVNLYGYVKENNGTYNIPINCYERTDFYNRVYFQNTTSSIYIGTTGYYPDYVSWVITIEYTKSTDTSN